MCHKCIRGFSPGKCYPELDKEGNPTSINRKPSMQDSAETVISPSWSLVHPPPVLSVSPVSRNTANCSPESGPTPRDFFSTPPGSVPTSNPIKIKI